MSNLPNYFGAGTRTVTTAGTQVKLSATSIPCYEVQVVAPAANSGAIYYGTTDVDNTYPALAAGDAASIPINDVSKVWIDAATDGDTVDFLYTAPINPAENTSPLYAG